MADKRKTSKPGPSIDSDSSAELCTVVGVAARGRSQKSPRFVENSSSDVTEMTLPTSDLADSGLAAKKSNEEDQASDERIGCKFGRYVIVSRAGAGGMGVVYKAYDPELDRRVALKLLTSGASGELNTQDSQSRLVREAQALAKLAHPNVIAVYDVGVVGDDIFVAMEFVEGGTIKEWLSVRQRSVDEILQVFRAAGRGLAAAHAAGLIHRDFKPANVIVGDDGRVRVLDFGLARAEIDELGDTGQDEDYDSARSQVSDTDSALQQSLTVAGAVMGTPPYMAPEQHRGESVDSRTDQFAFCVSLYEAIYGERPFAGATQSALRRAIVKGRIRDSTSPLEVPAWLRKVILRGLSVESAARYDSMDALLADLPERRRSRRRQVALGVGMSLVLGTMAVMMLRSERAVPVCDGGQAKVGRVWNSDIQKELEASLVQNVGPRAQETTRRLRAELDQYTGNWLKAHRETCEATHVRGEQSEALLDLRMACLSRRLDKVQTLTDVLKEVDSAEGLDSSLERVHLLPNSSACENTELLTQIEPLPIDTMLRERIVKVRALVDSTEASALAGGQQVETDTAALMMTEALAIGYEPVVAEMRHALATIHSQNKNADAEQTYYQAVRDASQARDDVLLARVWIDLSYYLGVTKARYDSAKALALVAEQAVHRAGGGSILEATRLENLGRILREEGLFDAARRNLTAAVETFEAELGQEHPRVAESLSHLGSLYNAQGEYKRAHKSAERAIAIFVNTLGAKHLRTARALNELGNALFSHGQYDDARKNYELALAIRSEALGEDAKDVAIVHTNLGNVAASQRRFEDGLAHQSKALSIRRKTLTAHHPDIATSLHNLANIHVESGSYQVALETFRESIAVRRKTQGDSHPYIAVSLVGTGDAMYGLERYEEAAFEFSNSLEMMTEVLGATHPYNAYAATGVAKSLLALQQAQNAVAPIERALALREGKTMDPGEQGDTRWVAARVYWMVAKKNLAIKLAVLAKENFELAGAARRSELADVEAWLSEHAAP